ncbi:MAG TPA: hypothetical protein VHB72_03810, partial [Candidatus Saccharimonadales bacterium]|nr:hypothetical protein [Candidatus Saccharimonadales bacterium]
MRAAVLAGLLLVAVATAGSAQAAGLAWSSPKLIDSQAMYSNFLEGAACPSSSFCVLGDNSGHVLTSTDPAAESWSAPAATGGIFTDLSCPSASFCAGVGGGRVNISTNPSGGSAAWTATEIDPSYPELSGISCASSSLCVAVDLAGHILTSTDPSGGAGAWNMAGPISGIGRLYGVSCPTESFCAAVGLNGAVLTSTNPSGGAGVWMATAAEPAEGSLFGIDCVSASFCAAAGDNGAIVTSTNPMGGSAAWSVAHIGTDESLGGALGRISCPSASFCGTGSFGGYAATSFNPTGGAGAWTVTDADNGWAIMGLACPSASLCIAGDSRGSVITTGAEAPPTRVSLSINRTGSGGGTVYDSTDGINCGSVCSASLPIGTRVYLLATAEVGSTFVGWSGANCSGTGSCVLELGA